MPFQTRGGVGALSDLEIDTDKDWKGYEILNVILSLYDDQNLSLGTDDDFRIRYESADDEFHITADGSLIATIDKTGNLSIDGSLTTGAGLTE